MKTILYNIGHRGAFLILTGIAFILYGVGLKYINFGGQTTLFLSLHQWGFIWIISGGLILAGSFGRTDKCSFTLAALISAWWSSRWAWLYFLDGNDHAWPTSALWAAIVLIILLVSSWPEYGERPKIERDRE